MKIAYFFALLILFSSGSLTAQSFSGVDKSPMDMSYFPINFAHDREGNDEALIRIIYSRPQKRGRKIFGGIVAFDEVWRMGANESTEIKLYKDATVAGKILRAGTYSLFAIPGPSEWTIIFNRALDYWGAYSYDEANDVLRVSAPVTHSSEPLEYFSIGFVEERERSATMFLSWDQTVVHFSFDF